MNASIVTDKLKQYPLAVLCAILLIVCGVVIFLRGGVVSELSLEESDLDDRIRVIKKNVKNTNGLEEDTEALKAYVAQIDSRVFDPYERAMNVSFFYEFEDKADVVISNISQLSNPDPIYSDKGPRKLKEYSTLVYSLTLDGPFTEVLKLLYEMDQAESILRVADFQLMRNKEEAGTDVQAKFRVLVLADNN